MPQDKIAPSQTEATMQYNAVEEPVVYDGGCLCTLLRYRITVPADSEYPIAGHCHCNSCRKSCSTFTSTSIIVPTSCLQWAIRISHPFPSPPATVNQEEQDASTTAAPPSESSSGSPMPEIPSTIPTVGPSESSLHRKVWRRLSTIAAIEDSAKAQQRAGSQSEPERTSTDTIRAERDQIDDPPAYQFPMADGGVEIQPGLKIPAPYTEYESSPGVFRGFCSWCGSSLIFRTACPGTLYIKSGTLDDPAKANSGRFDTELWTSNRFPEDWGVNVGSSNESGEVQMYPQNG